HNSGGEFCLSFIAFGLFDPSRYAGFLAALPLIVREAIDPLLDPLDIGVLREVCSQCAATVGGTVSVDSGAPSTKNAGPRCGDPCDVYAQYLRGVTVFCAAVNMDF